MEPELAIFFFLNIKRHTCECQINLFFFLLLLLLKRFSSSLPSLQVHGTRALRGSGSTVVHQNLCQVQEKHRGVSDRSVPQAARSGHADSSRELRDESLFIV